MSQDTQQHGLRKWLPLVALSLALSIIIIDNKVLNVSINNILSDLNVGLKEFQWATTLYSLILAAFVVTFALQNEKNVEAKKGEAAPVMAH